MILPVEEQQLALIEHPADRLKEKARFYMQFTGSGVDTSSLLDEMSEDLVDGTRKFLLADDLRNRLNEAFGKELAPDFEWGKVQLLHNTVIKQSAQFDETPEQKDFSYFEHLVAHNLAKDELDFGGLSSIVAGWMQKLPTQSNRLRTILEQQFTDAKIDRQTQIELLLYALSKLITLSREQVAEVIELPVKRESTELTTAPKNERKRSQLKYILRELRNWVVDRWNEIGQ